MPSELAVLPAQQPATLRVSMQPTTVSEAHSLAVTLAESTVIPPDYRKKPADVLATIMFGAEIGLPAIQSLESIATINGRRSVWGDSMLAIVMNHPAYETHDEGIEGEGDKRTGWFTIKRRGHAPYTERYSVKDATVAKLWGKPGPWTTNPDRMLKLRARGFALRSKFPDALKGLVSREEAQDYEQILDNAGHTVIDAAYAKTGAIESAQAAQNEAQKDAPITPQQRRQFYDAWTRTGKSADQVKQWMQGQLGITESGKILQADWEKAIAFAESEPEDPMREKCIDAMEALSYTPEKRAVVLKEFAGKLDSLYTALEAELAPND